MEQIKGFEQYLINEDGTKIVNTVKDFEVKITNTKNGVFATLRKPKSYSYIYCSVARLVCLTFNGEQEGRYVRHIDGNKSNNHFSNLELVSASEVIGDAYAKGTKVAPSGKKHYNFGKKIKRETVDKMSLAKLGENHPKFKGWYCFGEDRYGSAQLGAKAHGTYQKKVYNLAMKGEGGWRFEAR